jgi:hypothetical protein
VTRTRPAKNQMNWSLLPPKHLRKNFAPLAAQSRSWNGKRGQLLNRLSAVTVVRIGLRQRSLQQPQGAAMLGDHFV